MQMTAPPDASPHATAAHPPEWEAAATGAVFVEAPGLGLLALDGPDAATFLQGQLSNDVTALSPGQGHWTTYNSPKGRMLATLFLVRHPGAEGYAALVSSDLAEPVRKRLAMFVLRAKVVLRDASADHVLFGIGGPRAAAVAQGIALVAPGPAHATTAGGTTHVHLPDGRFVVIATQAGADGVRDALARHATVARMPVWAWLGVKAGVPMVTAATQDQFVAQAANWDVLGGISFRKGCYTGQEIVARTQHLGRLKERLSAFRAAGAPPPAGTRLYSEVFGDQASGTVVNSAPDPDGGTGFLAVAQIAAADAGAMAIGAPDGPKATRVALPYDLPSPSAPRGRAGA